MPLYLILPKNLIPSGHIRHCWLECLDVVVVVDGGTDIGCFCTTYIKEDCRLIDKRDISLLVFLEILYSSTALLLIFRLQYLEMEVRGGRKHMKLLNTIFQFKGNIPSVFGIRRNWSNVISDVRVERPAAASFVEVQKYIFTFLHFYIFTEICFFECTYNKLLEGEILY